MKIIIVFLILLFIGIAITFLYSAVCVSGETEKYYEKLNTPTSPNKRKAYDFTGTGFKYVETDSYFCPNCDCQVGVNVEYCGHCYQRILWQEE